MASEPFTLAQLARAAGVSVEKVRFYQDRKLLQPARRRRGRSDDIAYYREHVDRLRFIERAIRYGFSFETIAHLVSTDELVTCNDVYRLAADRLAELRQSDRPDPGKAAALARLMNTCHGVGGRNDCQLLAALEKDGDAD